MTTLCVVSAAGGDPPRHHWRGILFGEIPVSSTGMTYHHYPVRLRFATARHPFASEGDF
ncbi:MAG: hypothetical protein LBB23_01580 [Rickettsiales bacterium]|nr:hypothetical protein [Rickettsiales bacterium]